MAQRINHFIELPFLFNESNLYTLDESKKSEFGDRVSLAGPKNLISDAVREFGVDSCENGVSVSLLRMCMEGV